MAEDQKWRDRVGKNAEGQVDIDAVIEIAKQSGQYAQEWRKAQLDQRGEVPYYKKADLSLVTEEDVALNQFLKEKLAALAPDIPIVAEENSPAENVAALKRAHGTYWCIDPIDGTSGFISQQRGWGVLISLVQDGVPKEGVAYYPDLDRLYFTRNGKAVLRQGGGRSAY